MQLQRIDLLLELFEDRYGSCSIYSSEILTPLRDFYCLDVDYCKMNDVGSCIEKFTKFREIVDTLYDCYHIDLARLLTCRDGRKYWIKSMRWITEVITNAPSSSEVTIGLRSLRTFVRSVKFHGSALDRNTYF